MRYFKSLTFTEASNQKTKTRKEGKLWEKGFCVGRKFSVEIFLSVSFKQMVNRRILYKSKRSKLDTKCIGYKKVIKKKAYKTFLLVPKWQRETHIHYWGVRTERKYKLHLFLSYLPQKFKLPGSILGWFPSTHFFFLLIPIFI